MIQINFYSTQLHTIMKNRKILISGSGGFIGSYLAANLRANGDKVLSLSRNPTDSSKIFWAPDNGILDNEKIEGIDAVINLAGESIFGYWTRAKKKRIMESRVNSVRTLAAAIRRLKTPPKVFISASAVGYYGINPAKICDENSSKGAGFLADVCEIWERECAELSNTGIRVVNPRFGVVIDNSGGMLKSLVRLAKFKTTINYATKEDTLAWISLKDLYLGLDFCLEDSKISGAVNFVSPKPTSLFEINKILKKRYNTIFNLTLPKPISKIFLGEMAESLILSSARVVPKKLLDGAFKFSILDINDAL